MTGATKPPHPRRGAKNGTVPGIEGRNKNLQVNQQPFVPTEEQRGFIAAMSGFKFTHEELASLVIDHRTQKAISISTLEKYFREELGTGKQRLKSAVGARYLERLKAGEWNAIHFGLKHFFGYTEDKVGAAVSIGKEGEDMLRIEFVLPDPQPEGD